VLLVSGAGASASVVCALLFVALKSISPINDPATPVVSPADRGECCKMSVVVFKASSPLSAWLVNHASDIMSFNNGPLKSPTGEIRMGGIDYVSELVKYFCKVARKRRTPGLSLTLQRGQQAPLGLGNVLAPGSPYQCAPWSRLRQWRRPYLLTFPWKAYRVRIHPV